MYAIIESCGKQYKVAQGDVVFFEKLDTEEGKKVTFDNVVLVTDGEKIEIGNPYVKGFKVEGKVVAHGKGKKIIDKYTTSAVCMFKITNLPQINEEYSRETGNDVIIEVSDYIKESL